MPRNRRSRDERQIIEMFTYMRPRGSVTEQEFVDRFLTPLGFKRDAFQNLVLQVGDSPSILWSSHMDTVHSREGRQRVHYDGTFLSLTHHAKRNGSSCLGADDTAGVWLMTEMVKAGVEGLYVIHHGEESGCIGSGDKVKYTDAAEWSGIKAAIAFDRMGYDSVITHQASGRTSSDAFAKSMAAILGGRYEPDPTGSYTDTNEYAGVIPECTNISVGYFRQHTKNETQDVQFLIALRDALVGADWSTLVIERDPSAWDDDDWGWGRRDYGYGSYRGSGGGRSSSSAKSGGLDDLCKQYPEIAADLLEAMGIDRNEFMDRIADYYGFVFGSGEGDDDEDFDDADGWQFNREKVAA